MLPGFDVGVQLPEVERDSSWADVRSVAIAAEEAGLGSIWLGDHLLYRDDEGRVRGPLEAWSTLAALAEATSRVTLGPLVAATGFHSPAMLAKKAATIDDISGGRLVLGLGAGWNRREFDAFGFPYDHRVGRFEESFTIIRRLLDGEVVDFEGRYHSVSQVELVPRPTRAIPLLIGSNSPRMLAITLPHVAMWNTWHSAFDNDPGRLGPLLAEIESACAASGRQSGEVAKTAAVYVQFPGGTGRVTGNGVLDADRPITGSRQQLAEVLDRYRQTGLAGVQLVLDPIVPSSVEEVGEVIALLHH